MSGGTAIAAVLFDLDGTLLDTAPDLARAVNRQRRERGLDAVPLARLRPAVSQGARGMLRVAFDLHPGQERYEAMREEFLAYYLADLCVETRLFPGMEAVLRTLEADGIAWGIVTNKLHRFTEPLLARMALGARAACVVSGDTAARAKPHPDPLLEAARRIDMAPERCLYVGDDERDVQAAHAARMIPVVALWGYLGDGNPPKAWGAPHLKAHPGELLRLLGPDPATRLMP
ncbi:MAG: phosphoglycolate phosphatase [Burkholderiales bacterium]|nr:phosphoglycolate phosphatase [Burkholderiales bacterium]